MTDLLRSVRRYSVHVPQLVGRISYPQQGQQTHDAMRRLVSEYDTAMAELQNFLKYIQNAADEAVVAGAFYPADPEAVDASAADPGDPTLGWSPGNHKHQALVGSPTGLGNANAPGVSDALARADHVHKRDVRVKLEGVDVATRNALDFRSTMFLTALALDDPGNDEVDVGFAASPFFTVTSVVGSYAVLPGDFVVLVDASGGDATISLPAASAIPGRWVEVKKIDSSANLVIIDADGADLIDGFGTQELGAQYEAVPVVSDGSDWNVL